MSSPIAHRLLEWYSRNARQLPWRGLNDPYAIWISETMLQQTRVDTVIPYFLNWMKKFPTVASLASATQQEVLSAWEGLGYYGRARNIHQAAKIIVEHYGGQLPRDLQQLQKLPGIGRYTAGAIASIAFGMDVPTLDGNIRRVLARLFDVQEPARSVLGERRLWELVAANLPPGKAGDYHQALMDLGATICTPRQPKCPECPVRDFCQAYSLGIQEERPVLKPRPALPHYRVTAAIIQRDGRFLIARRPQNGLLGGLWEFPGGKQQYGEDLPACLQREICEELGIEIQVGEPAGIYRHAYTHFRVTLYAFHCQITEGEPIPLHASEIRWVKPSELAEFPMGKIDRQIASDLLRNTPMVQ